MAYALLRLPQYNSVREEVIHPVIPLKQLAAPVVTRAQAKVDLTLSGDLSKQFKEALKTDEWQLPVVRLVEKMDFYVRQPQSP